MSTWKPGQPVLTERDRVEWIAWRTVHKRQQQRDRRVRLRRIDFHASPDTAAALDLLRQSRPGDDFSSIIDRIIRDWVLHCHRNK